MLQRLEREVGIDRLGAVAGQGAEVMDLSRFAGFHHQTGGGPQALADQMVVQRRRRQQRRDGDAVRRGFAVGDDQDVVVGQNRVCRLGADSGNSLFHALGAVFGGPGGVDGLGAERAAGLTVDVADLFQIGVGQDRLRHFQPVVVAGVMPQQVRARADHGHQRHHQFLADRIDRRVGDLGEILLEIMEQQLGLVGQDGDGRVGAHGSDRVVALARHRFEEEVDVFLGVAEGLLLTQQLFHVVRTRQRAPVVGFRQVFQLELGLLQPFAVGVFGGELRLDLGIVDDAAFFKVDQQHFAGLEAPFADDFLLRHRQHTRLGGHDDVVVVGDDVARRAQAVAVQRGADLAAVGEGDGGGAVPRLHQRGVVFVEGLAVGIHQRVAGPCLGDQHHHGVRERVAAGDQDFQGVVDAGRVGLAVRDDRPHLVQVRPDQVGGHRPAARIHPIDVAADGVDFAVMRQEPGGVRELPGRERVGGEALMHHRQRRGAQRVGQVLVEAADLGREQQALVDHGAGREGRHVQLAQAGHLLLFRLHPDVVQDLLADREDLPLERVLVLHRGAGGDNGLLQHGHGGDDGGAEAGFIGGDIAPADQGLAFLGDHIREMLHGESARGLALRQEAHGDGVAAWFRQGLAVLHGPVAQQRVGDLDQAAGPVPHQRIGADGAPVIEVFQDFQALGDDVVRLSAFDIHDKADAAGVMLIAGVVQALSQNLVHRRSLLLAQQFGAARKHPFCRSGNALARFAPQCSVTDRRKRRQGGAWHGRVAFFRGAWGCGCCRVSRGGRGRKIKPRRAREGPSRIFLDFYSYFTVRCVPDFIGSLLPCKLLSSPT